jgi:hypothetical protein
MDYIVVIQEDELCETIITEESVNLNNQIKDIKTYCLGG